MSDVMLAGDPRFDPDIPDTDPFDLGPPLDPVGRRRPSPENDGRDGPPPKPRPFALRGVGDIFAELPPIPWLCEPLGICPGAPTLMAGYGYSGKTVAAQALAVAVASGTQAWSTFRVRQGPVVHLDYEQGWRLTAERYQRLCRAESLGPVDLGDRLSVVSMPSLYLDQAIAADALCWLFEGRALCIVDSYRAASPTIDENDSASRLILDNLTRASEKTGCASLVLLHSRKPQKDHTGGARMSIRGSGGLYDACSSCLVLTGTKGEPVLVEHEKERATGRCLDDFRLVIEDEERDGDPRGGLVVRAEACGPESRSDGQALEAVQERILGVLREARTVPSFNALAELVKLNRARVRGALDLLVQSGEVTERPLGRGRKEIVYVG